MNLRCLLRRDRINLQTNWMHANLSTKHTGYPFTRDGQRLSTLLTIFIVQITEDHQQFRDSDMLTAHMNWIACFCQFLSFCQLPTNRWNHGIEYYMSQQEAKVQAINRHTELNNPYEMRKEVWHASRTYISRIELKYIAFAGRIRERNDITAYTCRTLNAFLVNILKYAKI